MTKKKTGKSKHFRNEVFLKALGQHCRRLRNQRGYSIDRLAKESEQLSPSVVHRLENGLGAVTVSALFRYSQALGLQPRSLFDFELSTTDKKTTPHPFLELDDPRVKTQAFVTLLPLYSFKAAAGYFGAGESVQPKAWIEVGRTTSLDKKMFVVQARGNSMLPKIHDGDYLVFKYDPTGSRQGKIVLAQYRGPADPETGGSYTVKQYFSSKVVKDQGWRHKEITLKPLNPEYEPIVLHARDEDDFRIVGEYLFTL